MQFKRRIFIFLLLMGTVAGVTFNSVGYAQAECREWSTANYQHVEEGRAYTSKERQGCHTVTS